MLELRPLISDETDSESAPKEGYKRQHRRSALTSTSIASSIQQEDQISLSHI
jgi:hypothetical protein